MIGLFHVQKKPLLIPPPEKYELSLASARLVVGESLPRIF
jgi:hypothetical protein